MKIEKRLIREQLDETLDQFKVFRNINPPPFGWIKAIRSGLGMSGRQLAKRIGITKQSISRIEKDEVSGSITLKTLRNVAEGLDCFLVYCMVPKTSLEDTVRKRSEEISRVRMGRIDQTMSIEEQEIRDENLKKIVSEDVKEMVDKMPRYLWD